jgi:hypothetical protein
MTRATLSGWLALALFAGCTKPDDPQPRLAQPARPDRKFDTQSMNTAPGGMAPAKRSVPAP